MCRTKNVKRKKNKVCAYYNRGKPLGKPQVPADVIKVIGTFVVTRSAIVGRVLGIGAQSRVLWRLW